MIKVVEVTANNIDETGFFCMRSKPKSEGYLRKKKWLISRFQEGLKLKIIEDDGHPKGFIEYIPIDYSWRGVQGSNYMVIHCMWIVGKSKGKGYGSRLLNECITETQASGMSGVAMVTSSNTWLADKEFFIKQGFELVETTQNSFDLIVKRFDSNPYPSFTNSWEESASKYNDGLTIFTSNQCPYIYDAVNSIVAVAQEKGISTRVIEVTSSKEAQYSSSPYGVFNVIYNGKLITYHPVTRKELYKLLEEA